METLENFINRPEKDFPQKGSINEAFSYDLSTDREKIDIHIKDLRDKTLSEKLRLLRESFQALAKIVKSHPEIKQIQGTSWIIRKQPRLLEKLGFSIDNSFEVAKKNLSKYKESLRAFTPIPLERRNIEPGFAFMSREDFLMHYYQGN